MENDNINSIGEGKRLEIVWFNDASEQEAIEDQAIINNTKLITGITFKINNRGSWLRTPQRPVFISPSIFDISPKTSFCLN